MNVVRPVGESLPIDNNVVRDFIANGPGSLTLKESAAKYLPGFEFREVATQDEFERAARIVYNEYIESGYMAPNPHSMRTSIQQLSALTRVFIGIYGGTHILGTITVVVDSPLGLPIEKVFQDEVNEYRLAGFALAEPCSLAVDTKLMTGWMFKLSIAQRRMFMFHLIRAMYDYLRVETPVDCTVACFNPKHDAFYKFLDMERIGERKAHEGVQGNPAVARALDFRRAVREKKANATARLMFGEAPIVKTVNDFFELPRTTIKKITQLVSSNDLSPEQHDVFRREDSLKCL